MTRPRFLLDVDGVLADFSGGCLDLIERMTGHKAGHDDITQWSITSCAFFQWPDRKQEFWQLVGEPGFCAELRPVDGARLLVDTLKEIGDVYAVTTPYNSPTWMRERADWLQEHMGIVRERVIFTADKHLIRGSVLVDDKPEHVEEWSAANLLGTAYLVDQPYNRTHRLKMGYGRRVTSLYTLADELAR